MSATDLRISLIQAPLEWENPAANRIYFESRILALKGKTDLVLLPEMFTTGFSMNAAFLAEPHGGETAQWMRKLSVENGMYLTGSVITSEDGKYYNRLYWSTPQGEILHYDKRHLFRMAGEDQIYGMGNRQVVVACMGWRVNLLVCYDLRFPVWSRNINHYDLLVCVANWPAVRAEAWKILARARAVENLCYVAALNRVGEDAKGISYSGDSLVVEPRGMVLLEFNPEEEGVKTIRLSMKNLMDYRKKFPAHLDADAFALKNIKKG
jgi:predicted amidohydrolase